MPWRPTKMCGYDSPSIRSLACSNVEHDLRQIFDEAKGGLTIINPGIGDVFGVLDFESDKPVSPEMIEQVKAGLKEWGYDFPVIALPGGKGAECVSWIEPSDYRIRLKLDL